MSEATIIGLVVSALVVLVGLFISLGTPIIKLNRTIQKLNDSIDRLNQDADARDAKIQELMLIIEKHAKWLLIDKKRLDNQSKRLAKLDGETGFDDSDERK